MIENILGIDLGTSSIGLSLRNTHLDNNLKGQLEYFAVDIFKAGVGKDKSGEYSFAAERTKNRQSRKLKRVRRFRLWETLKILIEYDMCPLSQEKLKNWMTYNKSQNLKRDYPADDYAFAKWIALDFDGDGNPDYSSPYQLRRELATIQLDFNIQANRYKLGRALYHIAQRRGFKSSKGETISDTEKNNSDNITSDDVAATMKKSEEKCSKELVSYIKEHNLHTVGEAFSDLEDKGIRIRNSIYKAVRSQYEEEITYIFQFQNDLNTNSDLYIRLISKKKGEGSIFYKKPLKSQKGLVGKCTLEPNKARCPECHPEYEKFRALCFINNIRYRKTDSCDWISLPTELREEIYKRFFISRVKDNFFFKEIREFLDSSLNIRLQYKQDYHNINYRDSQNVCGCPVTARLIKLLGDDWASFYMEGTKMRTTHGSESQEKHQVKYDAYDIWHICFQSDDPEELSDFARRVLNWDEEKEKKLIRLWSSMRQGYATLSLKALKNINQFLSLGLMYSDAVLLAKIPDITNLSCKEVYEKISPIFSNVKESINKEKTLNNIANSLIADYKSQDERYRHADHNTSYTLNDEDKEDIINHIISHVGQKSWELMDANEQEFIINGVSEKYQGFFKSYKREFYKLPHLGELLRDYLQKEFPYIAEKRWSKLYHPSQIDLYSVPSDNEDRSKIRLGSPVIGAMRNPVVLRTLHVLKRKINKMLDSELITPENTRIVIETTRGMNDANKRWAIEKYQQKKEEENQKIRTILAEFYTGREISVDDIDTARYIIEQTGNDKYKEGKIKTFDIDVTKYKLWLEQGCQCIYTGKTINLTNLFDDNAFDLEHTIPRSISFDNSDANLTVCDAYYNRAIKKNLIPTQLRNYEKAITVNGIDYPAIKDSIVLKRWEEKVEKLQKNVDFWKSQSRRAQEKQRKDHCIRQRHLWQMELDYWKKKLERFQITEITDGFKNSQLVDTGIITKYATLYLKSVFNNVDVQKGSITSVFRKILGIQSFDEKKDRAKHTHHAIDATVLTTIPIPAKRKRMLELFYKIEETKKLINYVSAERATSLSQDLEGYQRAMERELSDCCIGKNVTATIDFIEKNLLINHHTKDQTLTPAHKRIRNRGRIVYVTNKEGEKVNKWATGDSIRGRLHNETYYGAIQLPIEEGTGVDRKVCIRNGKFQYPETETISMVIRTELKSFKKIDEISKIIDEKLRTMIHTIVTNRMQNGMTFTEAINQDIYMLDHDGNEIKQDKKGRPLCPIRHVRCKVAAGRGYMSKEKSLEIRHHIFTSKKKLINIENRDYKKYAYAQNDNNYLFLLYEGIKKGKLVRQSRIIGLFEATKILKTKDYKNFEKELANEPFYKSYIDKNVEYRLSAIMKTGTRVIMWKETPDEILDLSKEQLFERLYVVGKFNNTGSDHIYLRKHTNATEQYELQLVPDKLNCLIEKKDFVIDDLGNVSFID